jgi:hypothetical protein
VRAPRVNDKRVDPETGQRQRVSSAILPAWCRKRPQVTEVLSLLHLHGLSSGDFGPALEQFLGIGAGLSASAITRLTGQWQDEARAFGERDLSGVDYVVVWVDGIHLEFYHYPVEHWVHLRTTNPIGSTFVTVGLGTKVTKGPGGRAAGIAMADQLIEAAPGPLAVRQRPIPGRPRRRRRQLRQGKLVERPANEKVG